MAEISHLAASGIGNKANRTLFQFAHAAFVLTGAVTTFLGPLLPALTARWNLSDAQAGYFFSAQFLGSIAGGILSSVLLPRRGFRFSLALGYGLMAAGVAGLAFTEWRLALFSTLTYGLALGMVIPASNLLVSGICEGNRAAAISILNLTWSAGAVLAPFAVSLAETRHVLWDSVVGFAGVLLLAAISLLPAAEPLCPGVGQGEKVSWREMKSGAGRALGVMALMFFLYVGAEASLGGWIAALMKRASGGQIPLWLPATSIYWAGLMTGRGLAPAVLQRAGQQAVVLAGLAMATLACGALIFMTGYSWMLAGAGIAGLGLAAVFPITVSLLARFGEMERAIGGPMFALAGLGGAILPWLVGEVSNASGSLRIALAVPFAACLLLLGLHGSNAPRNQTSG